MVGMAGLMLAVLVVYMGGISTNGGGALLQGFPQVSLVDSSAIARERASMGADQVSLQDISSMRRAAAAASAAQGAAAGPMPVGHVIHVDMPTSEMKQLKVGSIVKGTVRRPMLAADGAEEFNTLDFTGKVSFPRCFRNFTLCDRCMSDSMVWSCTCELSLAGGVISVPVQGLRAVQLFSHRFFCRCLVSLLKCNISKY